MKTIAFPAVRSLVVATALLSATGMAAAQQDTARIVVHDEAYGFRGSTFDDLDALETSVRRVSPRIIELDACGTNAARATKGAAHRFRDLPLLLRVHDQTSAACALAARAVNVSQRAGRGPSRIDDAAVANYWRQVMP